MTKSELIRHVQNPHAYYDRTRGGWYEVQLTHPESEFRKWTKEELENEHRRLHPTGKASA